MQVQVDITYTWKFDKLKWDANKEHHDSLVNNIKILVGDDNISVFHFLNDMCWPTSTVVVKEINEP